MVRAKSSWHFGSAGLVAIAMLLWACEGDELPRGSGPVQSAGSSTGGGTGQGGASASIEEVCEGICETKSQTGCADYDHDTCYGECIFARRVMPWCATEGEDWVRCVGTQPLLNFQCNPEMGEQPVLAAGCNAELGDLIECWSEGPGIPNLLAECSAMCSAQSGLACYVDSCEADCNAALADAVTCNGAFAGQVYCRAALEDPVYICGVSNSPELVGDACEFYDEIVDNCENG